MATRSHTVNTRANFQRVDTVTWVGNSCGRHGSYVFYKAFQFYPSKPRPPSNAGAGVAVRGRARDRRNTLSDGDVAKSAADRNNDVDDNPAASEPILEKRILSLGEFFFVQCRPEDPVCVGELQLLWRDKHSGQDLSSTRLYYLPETTPAGRTAQHGQDEVLAVSEKVVMRTNDLASWIVEPDEWHYGCRPPVFEEPPLSNFNEPISTSMHRYSTLRPCVNMSDVKCAKQSLMITTMCHEHRDYAEKLLKDKANDKMKNSEEQKPFLTDCKNCFDRPLKAQVLVLSLTSYCRHKAVMKRIQEANPDWLSQPKAKQLVAALGAYTSSNPKLRLVFCRESFDYSQLFEHDLICEEFAPVFKGRPRKRNKKPHQGSGKVSYRKLQGNEESRSAAENFYSDSKADNDEVSRNNRRRSKRKLPNRSSDDESFVTSVLSRLNNKRVRRVPYLDSSNKYSKASTGGTSKSEPSSPTEGACGEAEGNGIRRSKRRPRPRPSDLSIALRNSLLENHKIKNRQNKQASRRPRSSASSSSGSSRSSSPTEDSISRYKTPSPADSVTSASSLPCQIRNVQTSPSSPPDFTNILTSSTGDPPSASKDLDLSSDSNMYLRGLSEGHLPESKSEFLELLNHFMRRQNTPIGRIPSLGFKKLDLWTFFKLSQEYGGYDMITAKRLWKHVYDRMGGNPSCTSAATCTRKHFEKLLLPLEKYLRLRQALPNKEADTNKAKNEEATAVIKSESSPHLSTLNGRTFDGDVYFHNSASVASSTPKDESPSQKTLTLVISPTSVHSSPVDTSAPPPSKQKSASPIYSSSSSGMSLLSNGFNLESLVNNVVRSQFRESQQTKLDPPTKPTKSEPSPTAVDLIDLTESSKRSQPAPLSTGRPSSAFQKYPNLQLPARPQTLAVFTRTHCPRRSYAPPPFIPKPSTRTQALPQAPEKKDASFVELSRMDDNKSQKRPISYSTSPSSPKRSRDSQLLSDPLLHRRPQTGGVSSLAADLNPHRDNLVPTQRMLQNVKTESGDNEAPSFVAQVVPPRPSSGVGVYSSRQSTTPVRRDYRVAIEAHRSEHKPNIPDDSRSSSESYNRASVSDALKYPPPRRYVDPAEERKERSYYRPNGMLATHRERQLQAKTATPSSGVKHEKLNLDDRLSRPKMSIHNDRVVSRSSHITQENETTGPIVSRPPKPSHMLPTKQDITRSSFPSRFTVNHLTSASSGRTSLTNGSSAPQVVSSKEVRPQHPASIANSFSTSLPRFMDPRQLTYRPPADKETFRPPPGHTFGTGHGDRPLASDAYSATKRPGPAASSSSEKQLTPQDIRTLLEVLPRGMQHPSVPPAALEHLLQAKFPAAASLPQSLLSASPLGQFPMLSDALDTSLLLRRQQEGHLAAGLNRNPVMNEISLMRMYQQIAYNQLTANLRHLPSSAPLAATTAALNRPLNAAKHPGHPDVLSHIGTPGAMPQAPILVANPQPPQQNAPDVRLGLPFPYSRR